MGQAQSCQKLITYLDVWNLLLDRLSIIKLLNTSYILIQQVCFVCQSVYDGGFGGWGRERPMK
jgi:hypothetical protein